ncbi:MAG: hypothetical protein LBN04_07135 [Oscillospiraceae bacterium]|jgi:uncharacterized protein YgiM (DUF1202 family)|nr:hypothetical protein [Oscillospiraceae bacterium]
MKRIFAGILLAAMLLTLAPMALAQQAIGQTLYTGTLTTGTTVLTSPVEGAEGKFLPAGTSVLILQQSADWYQVKARADDVVGWVPMGSVMRSNTAPVIPGVVISENVSLRDEPRTNATRLARVPNGAVLDIWAEADGWYTVNYYDKDGQVFHGFVRADFIVVNPVYITTTQSTYVYSTPSRSSKKVGQITTGGQLLVIGEYNNFWVVNLRMASGFIYKGDVEGF